jgi:hypothetical protein
MAKLSDRFGMEHVAALGAGTAALKELSKDDGETPIVIREIMEGMAEAHAEACQILVQIINEEIAERKAK